MNTPFSKLGILVGLLLVVVFAVGAFSLVQMKKVQSEIELLGGELMQLSGGVSSLVAIKSEIFYLLEVSENLKVAKIDLALREKRAKTSKQLELLQQSIAITEQRDRGQFHDEVLNGVRSAIRRVVEFEAGEAKLLPADDSTVLHSDARLAHSREYSRALDSLREATQRFAEDALTVSRNHQQLAMLEISGFTLVALLLSGLLIRRIRRLQTRLVEVEKLALLGKTAVTLRHEINNPLTVIIGNSELLLSPNVVQERRHELIDGIKQMSTRISHVVRKLGDVEKIMTKEYLEGVEMLDLDSTK